MAIENRDVPALVRKEDFDPGGISPSQVIVVENAGKRAAYIGLGAGEASRVASYDELESAVINMRMDRQTAEDMRADIAVQRKEMERIQREAAEAVEKATRAVEAAEKATAAAQAAAEKATAAAQAAEAALAQIRGAITGLGSSLASSLSSVISISGEGDT